MAEETDFVSLNVGGVKFVTTKTTLLMKGSSQPSSFFSGLVSGDFSSPKDNDGAYLIDRNPEVFRVILECLRTGSLYLPKTVSLEQVIEECEYYCLDTLITTLRERLHEDQNPVPKQLPPPRLPTKPRLDGVYEANESIIFIDHERFVLSKIGDSRDLVDPTSALLAFIHGFPLPDIWNTYGNQNQLHMPTIMAQMVTATVSRGKYAIDDAGKMTLLIAQNHCLLGFLSHEDTLIAFDPRISAHTPIYQTYKFRPFKPAGSN